MWSEKKFYAFISESNLLLFVIIWIFSSIILQKHQAYTSNIWTRHLRISCHSVEPRWNTTNDRAPPIVDWSLTVTRSSVSDCRELMKSICHSLRQWTLCGDWRRLSDHSHSQEGAVWTWSENIPQQEKAWCSKLLQSWSKWDLVITSSADTNWWEALWMWWQGNLLSIHQPPICTSLMRTDAHPFCCGHHSPTTNTSDNMYWWKTVRQSVTDCAICWELSLPIKFDPCKGSCAGDIHLLQFLEHWWWNHLHRHLFHHRMRFTDSLFQWISVTLS